MDSDHIHPTALISVESVLATDVVVGPYAIIEGPVKIAPGCQIGAHAQIIGDVSLGENCKVGRAAIIGEDPQDLSFEPATNSGVRIGRDNTLRELVTIHRSASEGKFTTVGDGNFLMAAAHLAHDVVIGDHNVLANNVMLAGHVQVGNRVFLGGGTGVHQFARIGDYALTQGNSSITKDVPPYVIAYQRSCYGGLNVIGLRRAGFDARTRKEIKRAASELFHNGLPFREALAAAQKVEWGDEARVLVEFVAAESRKGVMTGVGRA
jgi:UDP-N-acetylglucosamine acyltransferase